VLALSVTVIFVPRWHFQRALYAEKESLKQSMLVQWTVVVRVETLGKRVWGNLWTG
jgi:hypothetical protein